MSDSTSQRALEAGSGLSAPTPAMPSVGGAQLYRGTPYLLLYSGHRHSLGWQDHRKAGPSFVVARLSRLDTIKVIERFPLTEQGWAGAWRALSGLDASAAAAIAARLAARQADTHAAVALAALDAESRSCLRRVTFNGGSGAEALAKGQDYDLRFLGDRIMVCPLGSTDAAVELQYRDIETVDVGGPGEVRKSPAPWILTLGLLGAVLGLLVLGLLGLLLGALVFGLVGALVGSAPTKIETVVRIRSGDAELYFLHTGKAPDALRIELSEPLVAIGNARAAEAGNAEDAAELASGSIPEQLSRLASLLERGLITHQEFEHLKAKLIAKA